MPAIASLFQIITKIKIKIYFIKYFNIYFLIDV